MEELVPCCMSYGLQNIGKHLAGMVQDLEETHTILDQQHEARQDTSQHLKWQ